MVFGPYPDDIEIGLGATVAKYVDLGCRVGLCDLTRGELSINGTVEERAEEALIAIPYWHDRYPDYEAASRLLTDATFCSGLRRYAAEGALGSLSGSARTSSTTPWSRRSSSTCRTPIHENSRPSNVIEASSNWGRTMPFRPG